MIGFAPANQAAVCLPEFLRCQLALGQRDFVLIPLFFGNSRALSRFVPDCVESARQQAGDIELRVAQPLCPLPQGEARLAQILCDHVAQAETKKPADTVVLVDHGSPLPEVTAVRQRLADQMRACLGRELRLEQAVMERRPGVEYDFNGPLLEDLLTRLAQQDPHQTVILSMLFFAPGRHAGPGGDIADIAETVQQAHPGFEVVMTPLIGEHDGLIAILEDRLAACVRG